MPRYVTGIVLKRYFEFTENQMRKLRKDVGIRSENKPKSLYDEPKWLYNIDEVLKNYKPTKEIPEHLIKEIK